MTSERCKSDPGFLAHIAAMQQANEAVTAYAGQDGFWHAIVTTPHGCYVEGRFDSKGESQEAGLALALQVLEFQP